MDSQEFVSLLESGIEQDTAEAVELYSNMDPCERGVLYDQVIKAQMPLVQELGFSDEVAEMSFRLMLIGFAVVGRSWREREDGTIDGMAMPESD
ncbi:MAG: hypothetical protein AAF711_00475 [Planctomycetota bacterium]